MELSIDAAVSGQEPSAPRGSKWAQKAALRKQTRQTQPPPTAVSELAKQPAVNPVFEPPPKPARKPQLEDSTPIMTQTPPPPLPPQPNPLSAFPLPNQPAFQPPLPQSHSEQSRDFTQPTPMPAPPSKPPQETKTAKKSASGELGPLPNSFDYLLLTPDIVADRVRKRNYPIPFPIFCVMWTKSDTILVGGGGGRPGTGIPSGALVCDIKKELPDPRSPLYDNGWSVVPYAEVNVVLLFCLLFCCSLFCLLLFCCLLFESEHLRWIPATIFCIKSLIILRSMKLSVPSGMHFQLSAMVSSGF